MTESTHNPKHPSTLTDDELKAMRESDPAAFDEDGDDDEAADTAGDEVQADPETPPAGDAPEPAAVETGEADAADGTVDKRAFNGLLAELRQTREEVKALKQAQHLPPPAAAGEPPRDFDAELRALRSRYDDDGDLTDEEYDTARTNLLREQMRSEMRQEIRAEAVEQDQAKAEQAWGEKIAGWEQKHADFLSNTIRREAVAKLFDTLGKDASLSDDELIARVEKEAFDAFNHQPSGTEAPTPPSVPANPHANRNAADAAAAAAASATPPSPTAGNGNRGGPAVSVDVSAIKQGDFSKLPKAEQEKLLGEGALD